MPQWAICVPVWRFLYHVITVLLQRAHCPAMLFYGLDFSKWCILAMKEIVMKLRLTEY